MATKKKRTRGAADDERKGRARFIDQPGQWTNRTPAATKRKQAKAWAALEKEMSKKRR